ncbi:MAG: rod shape-determining protein [Bacillota bacterium]
MSRDIGIDLGTANVLVYQRGRGIVVREPSVVAINKDTNEVTAVGAEAKEMLGRTPGNIVATRPIKDGVISDFDVTKRMLQYFIKKATKGSIFSKIRIVVCIPCGVTEVEKRAIQDSARQSGAKEVYLIEEPMAAAIGAGLKVEEPQGCMIVDIGGGTSEVAVISFGGIVSSRSVRIAGDAFDKTISDYVKKTYGMVIGETTAENVKIAIGCAYPRPKDDTFVVRGRDLLSGLPKTIELKSSETLEALREPVSLIIDAIKFTLEKTPPELSSDIFESGLFLAGGGALLFGLDKVIQEKTGLPVYIADNPLDCVAKGTGVVIEDFEVLRNVLVRSTKKEAGR